MRKTGRKRMDQDLNKIKNMYDTVAVEWAAVFADEHKDKPMDREILRRFAREIGAQTPVWELGCGPGNTARFLHDLGVRISGLDLSDGHIEQARRLHPGIAFRQGNMLALDFQSASVAGILAFYAIVHFSEQQAAAAFREIFRVLRPGGLLLFTYHVGDETIHRDEFLGRKVDIDFMYFTNDCISSLLTQAGFSDQEFIEREPYPDVEYQSRRAYVFAHKPAG
jgi:SAM-dependent methyltransferase